MPRRQTFFERTKASSVVFAAIIFSAVAIMPAGCAQSGGKFSITTSAFSPGSDIPSRFTCNGADTSPALSWSNPPAGTKSFVLIVDDPDAPSGAFTHWLVYDLSPTRFGLPEGVPRTGKFEGGLQGKNDFDVAGYRGPCPPRGKSHRYFFHLYALDTSLSLPAAATRNDLDSAMKGHVLANTELVGKFGH
jgi:Raf kinase inhibitor-like YbhB/YbcL family protein